jgi:hypothetical protein
MEKIDHETGVSDKRAFTSEKARAFPRLHIKVIVSRKSYYAVVNMILPTAFLVILCFLQFCIPVDEVADRGAYTLTLLMTASANKYTISTMVPSISYLTMLDKYVLIFYFLIFVVVLECGIFGRAATMPGSYWISVLQSLVATGVVPADPEDAMEMAVVADARFCYLMMVIFCLIQVYFVWRVKRNRMLRLQGHRRNTLAKSNWCSRGTRNSVEELSQEHG